MRPFLPLRLSLTCLPLTGCIVFPHPYTLRPEASFTVLAQGRPLANATVHLYSIANPHRRLLRNDSITTDASGTARFSKLSTFEWGSLTLHGSTVMYWGWCVEHEGYVTQSLWGFSTDHFRESLRIALDPGQSTGCEYQAF